MRIYSVLIFVVYSILNCKVYKSDSEKRNKCLQTYMATYTTDTPTYYTPGGYEFRFACSTEGSYNPTCIDYFSRTTMDANYLCPPEYKKATLRCSQQNIAGVCLETESYGTAVDGIVKVSLFSKVKDDLDTVRTYCALPERKGFFYGSYITPNDKITSLETKRNDSLILCLKLK